MATSLGALSGDMLEMRKCICQGEGGEGGERKLLGDMPGMKKFICQGQGGGEGVCHPWTSPAGMAPGSW